LCKSGREIPVLGITHQKQKLNLSTNWLFTSETKMAAKGVTLAATDFPLYTFRMVGDRHFLVAGGGGAAKTGVPNAMVWRLGIYQYQSADTVAKFQRVTGDPFPVPSLPFPSSLTPLLLSSFLHALWNGGSLSNRGGTILILGSGRITG